MVARSRPSLRFELWATWLRNLKIVWTKGLRDCATGLLAMRTDVLLSLTLFLFHGYDDSSPSIHNAFAQRHYVIKHVIVRLLVLCDLSHGFKYLSHSLQVFLEVWPNRIGYISEALKDCRLELVARRILQLV